MTQRPAALPSGKGGHTRGDWVLRRPCLSCERTMVCSRSVPLGPDEVRHDSRGLCKTCRSAIRRHEQRVAENVVPKRRPTYCRACRGRFPSPGTKPGPDEVTYKGRHLCRSCYEIKRLRGKLIDYPRILQRSADVFENIEDLRLGGVTNRKDIAARLGMRLSALEKILERARKRERQAQEREQAAREAETAA